MQMLHYHRKGAHPNKIEKFYIHAEFTANNHLNDNQTIFPNTIFDTLLNTHRSYPPTLPSHPTTRQQRQKTKQRPLHPHEKTHIATLREVTNAHTYAVPPTDLEETTTYTRKKPA
jgi:hypothetical protein